MGMNSLEMINIHARLSMMSAAALHVVHAKEHPRLTGIEFTTPMHLQIKPKRYSDAEVRCAANH
jgi:hypothetical protein